MKLLIRWVTMITVLSVPLAFVYGFIALGERYPVETTIGAFLLLTLVAAVLMEDE